MSVFEPSLMPDSEKRDMCEALLSEFGARVKRVTDKGEMIHSCVLPFGRHKNGDKSASASLNYKKLTYNCKGCNNKGGLLWFIGSCRGTTGRDARSWLDKETGLGGETLDLSKLLKLLDALYDRKGPDRTPMPVMDRSVLTPWLLLHPYMTDPIPEGRGIPRETLVALLVGFAERYRINENLTSERIVVPHFWKGNLVGWQTRRWYDDGTPKYLSSPDFPKDSTVYNYDPSRRTAVVVESPMSVLSKYHLEHHITSTFGASVTDRQMRLLSAYERVIMFMDNDRAGWECQEGTRDERGKLVHIGLGDYLGQFTDVWAIENPYAADPADMDDQTYLDLVGSAVPWAAWRRPETLRPVGTD